MRSLNQNELAGVSGGAGICAASVAIGFDVTYAGYTVPGWWSVPAMGVGLTIMSLGCLYDAFW